MSLKTIANLKGAEFLKAVNRSRHAVEKLLKTTNAVGIWKTMPTFEGNETEDEKLELIKAQVKRNLSDVLDSLLETNAEETYECIMSLCIFENPAPEPDGESQSEDTPEPDGIDLLMAALDIISDERVLSFFAKLMKSGLLSMGN